MACFSLLLFFISYCWKIKNCRAEYKNLLFISPNNKSFHRWQFLIALPTNPSEHTKLVVFQKQVGWCLRCKVKSCSLLRSRINGLQRYVSQSFWTNKDTVMWPSSGTRRIIFYRMHNLLCRLGSFYVFPIFINDLPKYVSFLYNCALDCLWIQINKIIKQISS